MNLGQLLIWLSFFTAIGAMFAFWKNRSVSSKAGVQTFRVMAASSFAASALLLYQLFTHQYQYEYVAKYSSDVQPFIYLVSAFWAGQEGTFLLWSLFTSVLGLFFIRESKKDPDAPAMMIVSGFTAFLFLIMLVKSPFALLTPVPDDGSGMNPLLQNPWMAIHPPILFLGYAACVFPFALAISSLIRKRYDGWLDRGFRWTLFASLALGAGIIIGAFWAYEVLGWGGYWGWDPVENSSLVPWLILLVLIHGLLIQKQTGALSRTNLFLAVLTFVLVLYATFLTRSGILADFSVHSFVDLGINSYLVGGMAAASALGFGFFAARFKQITRVPIDFSRLNREVALLLGMVALALTALFTFAGMSSPILTGLVGDPSQVDISFYNKVNLPGAIVMALLLGITPFLGWTEKGGGGLFMRLTMPLILTLLSGVIAYVGGVSSILHMLFIMSATFGVVSNVIVAFRQYRNGFLSLAGPMAHVGVGLLLVGIVGSSAYDETSRVVLRPGVPTEVYGYEFTLKGVTEANSLKPVLNIEVSDGRETFIATPKLYYSEYNRSMMREPDIKVLPLKDIYISPLEMNETSAEENHPLIELTKGESRQMGGYGIEFVRFETGQHGEPGEMAVGAVLKVTSHGGEQEITPQILLTADGKQEFVSAELPSSVNEMGAVQKRSVTLGGMSVEQKKVFLALHGFDSHQHGSEGEQELLLEVSTKPLMMVVWTGVVLIIGGSGLAWRKRAKRSAVS